MDFSVAINQILILFIIMFIGIVAKKKNVLNENVQSSISTILVKIGMPAMVLASTNFERNPDVLPNMIQIFTITVVSYGIIIGLFLLLARFFKYDKLTRNVFVSLITFANVGFMGYPITRAFFGEVGVFYAAIVNLPFTVLVWTFGILLFNSKEKINFSKLVNIGTISSIITVLLFLLDIRLPYALQTALDLTGKMTTPLSMLLIGAYIAEVNIKDLLTNKKVFLVSFFRLLAVPLATLFILRALHFNAIVIAICTIMAAMPSAATNAIFAKEYDSEPLFASIGVFVTTLLSIITLPLIVFLLTKLGV